MELTVLKFDSYPNAVTWLDSCPLGVAVKGFPTYHSSIATHLIFSKEMPESQRLQILEHFPFAERISLQIAPDRVVRHPAYLIHIDRDDVIQSLQNLGAFVKNSDCCLDSISTSEMLMRLKELEVRSGKPLSQVNLGNLGDLYRKLYP